MKCIQNCGRRVPKGRINFCSDECRHAYNPLTWGEGRKESLVPELKASLALVRKRKRARRNP